VIYLLHGLRYTALDRRYDGGWSVSWLQLVVLAVVQGITEFLPISSSAHLILVPALTDWPDQGLALDLAVHVGTLGAVLLYYRSDIRAMTVGGMALLRAPLQGTAPEGGARLLMALAVGALPVFIVGGVLVVMGWDELLRSAEVIGWASVLFGLLLYVADSRAPMRFDMDGMTLPRALVIGLAQVLAIVPGTSRACITMTAARFIGFNRLAAARFSMLLAIPTIAAGGLGAGLKLARAEDAALTVDALIAAGLSFVVAYVTIILFMRWLTHATMTPFVVYRVVLGVGLLAWVYL